ncbi:MAG: pilus assembly protein N-terminal domain-containing protein [Micavibrio sp.]|nr:pilus assembly protein N-terminal domain-containing protein [Micavibrio sp.]
MIKSWPGFVIALCLLISAPAFADGSDDISPATKSGADSGVKNANKLEDAKVDSDGIIRVSPGSAKVVRLDQDAVSVIVTNSAHAGVILDSPRLLVVMPRTPGATTMTVLNAKGETIVAKTIVVAAQAKEKYVRIRRMCSGADANCQPSAYFFCPDGCYEVLPVQPEASPTTVPDIVGNANINNGGDQQAVPPNTPPGPGEPR